MANLNQKRKSNIYSSCHVLPENTSSSQKESSGGILKNRIKHGSFNDKVNNPQGQGNNSVSTANEKVNATSNATGNNNEEGTFKGFNAKRFSSLLFDSFKNKDDKNKNSKEKFFKEEKQKNTEKSKEEEDYEEEEEAPRKSVRFR